MSYAPKTSATMSPRLAVLLTVAIALAANCSADEAMTIGKADVEAGLAIVIPKDSDEQVRFAAGELRKYLKEILGCEVPIDNTGAAVKGKCIRLCPEQPGPKAALGKEGYSIKTQDGQLVITGGLPRGIIYGVYSFLEDHLGCRWFTPKCQIIPKRDQIVLPVIDQTYVPPLGYRHSNNLPTYNNDWAAKHRINGWATWSDRYNINWHSLRIYVPPDKYFDKHPEYYALVGGKRLKDGQICLTNVEARKIAAEAVLKKMEKENLAILSVSQDEGAKYCQCDTCQAIAKREKSQSGPVIDFVNYVAGEVAKKHPERYILTLAYQWSINAPAHLRVHPNAIVQVCSIRCAFNHPLSSPVNATFQKQLKAWAAKCDRIFVWDYTINFAHVLAPHPNFNVIAPNVRFFLENNVKGIFEQGNPMTKGGEFLELRSYLTAKALWNPNIDTDQVIDEFVAGFYGPAGPFIRKYINRIHEMVAGPSFKLGIYNGCTCSSPTCSKNKKIPPYWSPETIKEFVGLFDQAEAAAAGDEVLSSRVRRARLPVMYKRISGEYMNAGPGDDHDPNLTYEQLGELITRFEKIARQEKVTHVCESEAADGQKFDKYIKRVKDWYAGKADIGRYKHTTTAPKRP